MADQRGAVTEEELDPPSPAPGSPSQPGFATTAIGPADVRDTPRVSSPVATDPDPWVGRVLSNVYRVEGKIGEGGMGAVYAARHVHLHKQYAVKVLSGQVALSAKAGAGNAIERLKQEAIAAS